MKKTKVGFLSLCSLLLLASCGPSYQVSSQTEERNPQIVTIYNLYLARGGTQTYEEWLASIRGEDGEPGQDGNGILSGFDVPSPSLGKNKDIYLNVTTWDIYVKEGNTWVIHGNIKGGQGDKGAQGDHGLNYSEENPQGLSFYLLDDGNYLVGAGYSTKLSDVVIPDTYGGKKVVGVMDNGFQGSTMSSLTVGPNLKTIGPVGFSCKNLKSVYYNGTIEEFLQIETSNTYAGSWSNLLQSGSTLYLLDPNGTVEHKGKRYSVLETLRIPEGMTTLPSLVMAGCSSLKELIIPSSVTTIEDRAFLNCENLETIVFEDPTTLTSLGSAAFSSNCKMEHIYVGSSKEAALAFTPGKYFYFDYETYDPATSTVKAYKNRYNLYYSNPTSGKVSYDGKKYDVLESLTISQGMTVVPDYMLRGCKSLKELTIPSHVTGLGEYAFGGCPNLESLVFESASSLTTIGKNCFEKCDKLPEVVIPESVVSVGVQAFSECDAMERFITPSLYAKGSTYPMFGSLFNGYYYSSADNYMNTYPASLRYISTTANRIDDNAFATKEPDGIETLEITNAVTYIGANALSNCTSLQEIIFHGTETEWNSIVKADGWLGNISMPNVRFVD
ncbi:MAG: leucine-rich repeat domain-containing protein [Bacilli bacterium]|nr:leucine-rich repeat domain-containing protein [Bacilli bacterium]